MCVPPSPVTILLTHTGQTVLYTKRHSSVLSATRSPEHNATVPCLRRLTHDTHITLQTRAQSGDNPHLLSLSLSRTSRRTRFLTKTIVAALRGAAITNSIQRSNRVAARAATANPTACLASLARHPNAPALANTLHGFSPANT